MIRKIIHWVQERMSCYVIADATDNSITFSRRLFRKLRIMKLSQAKVYVFWVPALNCYAFVLNPEIEVETQLSDIMYNDKHKCVGFESLVPTVNRIFYDYGLPVNSRCKLTVSSTKTRNGMVFHQICRPYEKRFR